MSSKVEKGNSAELTRIVKLQQQETRMLTEKVHHLTQQRFGRKCEQLSPAQASLFGSPAPPQEGSSEAI